VDKTAVAIMLAGRRRWRSIQEQLLSRNESR